MRQLSRMDRARGCLLGLAIGDALGAPLEGLSAQQIRAHYGLVDDYVDGARAWKKKPYRWRMPGLYSDDTQQAMALSDVLLECRREALALGKTFAVSQLHPRLRALATLYGVGELLPETTAAT